uniref:hypothetical protein n=1 Tax=uncultured Caulobacter sp. TaxID=158749 RepID=UPI0025E8EA22|nr:hypothetical protein [uncultured Caulobacter sp.]
MAIRGAVSTGFRVDRRPDQQHPHLAGPGRQGRRDGDLELERHQAHALHSAKLSDQTKLTAGAENLFDTYPDQATFQASRGLIYSRNAPYDTDGGLWYARISAKF